MDFTIGYNNVAIDFNELSDEQLRTVRDEVEDAGVRRGLWVVDSAGSLVVAPVVHIVTLRNQLLDSVEYGADLFNDAVEHINEDRKTKDQIPITPAAEYRERAEDWLNDERVEAAAQLPAIGSRPRLVVPRLSRPITHEEVVESWRTVTGGRLVSSDTCMQHLKSWTADQLSGHEPEQDDVNRLTIVPTLYDHDRKGTYAEQRANLGVLQTDFPELDVATIFEGSILARYYMNQPRYWRPSTEVHAYVRDIALEPIQIGTAVSLVPAAGLYSRGCDVANVYGSEVDETAPACLRVA